MSKEETTAITEAKVDGGLWNVSSFHGYTKLCVFILPVIELPLCKSIVASLIILNQFTFVQITLNSICQASLDSQSKAMDESLASIQEAFIAVTGMEVIEKKALDLFSILLFRRLRSRLTRLVGKQFKWSRSKLWLDI